MTSASEASAIETVAASVGAPLVDPPAAEEAVPPVRKRSRSWSRSGHAAGAVLDERRADRVRVRGRAGGVPNRDVRRRHHPRRPGFGIEQGAHRLVALPVAAWDGHSDRGEEIDEPGAWWVVVPLWSIASRMSSLSMEAIVRAEGGARGVGDAVRNESAK